MADYPPDPPAWQPVVALEHETGVAAVCRDPDGSLWLVWDLAGLSDEGDWHPEPPGEDEEWDPRDEFGDELLGYETAGTGTTVDGVAALAGRLPDGAARVEIRQGGDRPVPVAVDGAVWLAFPDPTSPVEPVVGDGGPVRSYNWEPGERAAVCRTCGYVQSLPRSGNAHHITLRHEAVSPEEKRNRWRAQLVSVWSRATASFGTPPIGLTRSWPGARWIEGWGDEPGESTPLQDIALGHGERWNPDGPWVSVATSAGPLLQGDRLFVEQWLEQNLLIALADEWRDADPADDASGELREQLRRRKLQARAQALQPQAISVPVDNEQAPFLMIALGQAWCAHGEHHGTSITLIARGLPPTAIALEAADVEMYLSQQAETSPGT
jgi:hypothetical protein